jgi:hypothetical protein
MSTDFRLLNKVLARDLFGGRLAEFGVSEHVTEGTTETSRCLTDGRNYLWVYIDDNGFVACMSRYGGNAPGKILKALAEAFDTDIVSEYEPQFYGFETQEEFDTAMEKLAREGDDKFYMDFLKYLRGEPHGIVPGTNGMLWAETGKKLTEKDPSLLLPENKDKLLKEMESINRVTIVLSPEQIALANLIATHEDDLPSA